MLLILAAACFGAGAEPAVTFGPQGELVALSHGGRTLAGPGGGPPVAILYSQAPDIWQAQSWQELQPDAIRVEEQEGATRLEIASFGGRPVRMRLTGKPKPELPGIEWSLSLANDAPGTVVGVVGPALAGVREVEDGVLYFPDRPGQRLCDPWTALAQNAFRLRYPVPASMQYVAYAGQAGGVAYHVRDRRMLYKELLFGGPQRELSVTQYPFVPPGGHWSSPPILWQALRRGWHEAADVYCEWFRSWAATPQVSPQVRSFPVMGGIVVRARPVDDAHLHDVMKRQEVGTYAAALARALELGRVGFDGMHLVGWFGQGHDTTYPEYPPAPEMGGEAGLKELVGGMHAAGMIATLYLNARLANLNSPVLQAHPEWRVRLPAGQTWEERYGDQSFTVLCPAAPGFRQHLRDVVLQVARDWEGDGVQLDQIGAASCLLCFNPEHGHSTPASAWVEGYPALLKEIRREVRAIRPHFWCWIEGAWEGAGQYVDLSQGGFWPAMPGAEYHPAMYRYTLPQHPLFGDPGMGGIPYWCPTDIHRARRINAAVGDVFWQGCFMDDIGLSVEPPAEAHWFRDRRRAVLTVRNTGQAAASFALHLELARLVHAGPPRGARALAAEAPVSVDITAGWLSVRVDVPAGQVEAVLLEW